MFEASNGSEKYYEPWKDRAILMIFRGCERTLSLILFFLAVELTNLRLFLFSLGSN